MKRILIFIGTIAVFVLTIALFMAASIIVGDPRVVILWLIQATAILGGIVTGIYVCWEIACSISSRLRKEKP